MQIRIERTKETLEKDFSGKARDLLRLLHIGSEEVLIIRNGSLVTEDEDLHPSDNILLLSVISGG